jgi:hypothetical protein
MASSRTLIESQTLASSAASVTFSSIPATYTDLVLRWSSRGNQATIWQSYPRLKINNSPSAVASVTYIAGNGATASSFTAVAISTSGQYPITNSAGNIMSNSAGNTTSTFDSVEIYIPSYTVAQNKPFSMIGAGEQNATTAYIVGSAALERNTSAITSLVIINDTGNFVSGSSFYLYGLKNS